MQARPPEPPFGHLLTAVITPFGDDGTIDYGAFWRLTRRLVADGSDGIVVAGTTGESPTLSTVEKAALFRAAVDAVGDRGLVIAGTGTYDTKESIELSEKAAEAGCDGIMLVTPYYSKPPQEGLYRHFTAVADAVDLPVLLYNIPGRTCRLIEVETLRRLADHPRIVAVKDAVDDLEWSRRAIEALPEGFAVYSGSDAMTLALMEHHAVGVVSVASQIAGEAVRRMVDAMLAGDTSEAERIDAALQPLYEALFLEPNPMPVKAGLNALWGDVGEPRLPLVPAAETTIRKIEEAAAAAEEL